MKVLQINAVTGYGSTGRACVEIADTLNKNNHEGYIAYSGGGTYINGYQIGTSIEKKIHGLFSRLFGNQAYYSTRGTKKLIKYIETLRPDIVHLNNLHGNYINLYILLKYLADKDISTVLTLHDCWFYTGKCRHYTVDNCFKWQTGCGHCPRVKKDNKSWFFDRSKKMFKDKNNGFKNIRKLAVVGVSEWITEEAKKSFLSSANTITKIYNWIDIDIFQPVETNSLRRNLKLDNKFVILGVASEWNNSKGLDQFLELAEKLPHNHKIVLVGKVDKAIQLPSNIISIPETQNIKELVEYYSMADVFVTLSLEETFGKVTAEALACGTPAIVYDSTACPELIGEKCGYVIEKNNINMVLKKILETENKTKEYYSKNCINFARENFNKDDRIEDYINLYNHLIRT